MKISEILIKPLVTEKSMSDAQKGVYTFLVAKKARKKDIKKTIEDQFKVKVVSLNTLIIKGRTKFVGRKRLKIKTSDFKKALAQVKTGQKIEIFETGK